jgi:hypothetical protein
MVIQIVKSLDQDSGEALTLVLPDEAANPAPCEIRLALGSCEISFSSFLFGFDLGSFADELTKLHATLKGTAALVGTGGEIDLRLTVVDPGRGRIAVGGSLSYGPDPKSLQAEISGRRRGPLPLAGLTITFGGLQIDQSELPGIRDAVRDFLGRTGISIDHPMVG